MQKILIAIAICFIAFGFTRAQDSAMNDEKLREIMKLLPVPENPDRVTEADWNEFETREKMIFPEDFKAFINVYSCGKINKTLEIMAPMCLSRKIGVRPTEKLLLEFCLRVFSPPTSINFTFPKADESNTSETNNSSDEVDGTNLSPEDVGMAFADFSKRSDELMQECGNLAYEFYNTKQYSPETSGLVVLEELREFLVAHYQDSEPVVVTQLKDVDLSQINLETQDETQYEFSNSLIENFEEDLSDLLSSSQENQQLNADRFYLWGDLRDSNYNLGWLTREDETGIQVISEKTFLFSHDKLELLDVSFLDVVLRLLQHDQTLFDGTEVSFQPEDSAFNEQKYEFIPNPNRRTP
jgi:hypothetical protein